MERGKNLSRVRLRAGSWDVVVIGGGATGVGCAVDAASRGLDVLLLEQHDFGKGTSSRSTKLIHGGVRYLAQGNLSLVREAMRERWLLLRNAAHVVHRQAFVVPYYNIWQKVYYGAGLRLYDLLAGKYSLGRSKILSREETLRRLPKVKSNGLSGGILYYDAQFDDTRLLIDLVRTAHERGGTLLNYARVTAVDSGQDAFAAVEFEDALSGERFRVSARAIINAAGIFSDAVRRLRDRSAEQTLTFSQGVHLVFDRSFLPTDDALLIPKTPDGRVLFCIPWYGHTLVGTTDTPVEGPVLEPRALESEIDFILDTVAQYLAKRPAGKDILSVFAGIRPLVKSAKTVRTASLSRGHSLFIDGPRMVTVSGGKWTTYRLMAEEAVDVAMMYAGIEAKKSRSEDLQIIDSTTPAADYSERLHPELPYTAADVIRAVREEMAQTVEDVLARRTRALFLNAKAAMEMAPVVARVMAEELSRDESWIEGQVREFEALAINYIAH